MAWQKVAIFVDVSNLYYCISKRWEGRKLDYEKYLEVAQEDCLLTRAIAYGAQVGDEAVHFITALRHFGYEIKYKTPKISKRDNGTQIMKADWDVGIAMDVIRIIPKVDKVVLGSADSDMEELVRFAKDQGVVVGIHACGISKELKNMANNWHEITEDMLVGATKTTESSDMSTDSVRNDS